MIVGSSVDASVVAAMTIEGETCELVERASLHGVAIAQIVGGAQGDAFTDVPPGSVGDADLLWRSNAGRIGWFDLRTKSLKGWLVRRGEQLVLSATLGPCDFEEVHHIARVGDNRVAFVYSDFTVELYEAS